MTGELFHGERERAETEVPGTHCLRIYLMYESRDSPYDGLHEPDWWNFESRSCVDHGFRANVAAQRVTLMAVLD